MGPTADLCPWNVIASARFCPRDLRSRGSLVKTVDQLDGHWRLQNRFDFRGHSIAWDCIGNGPPAVLLHGTPFSSVEWRRIAPLLAQERRVYYFDMLGYGRSDMPNADVSRGIQNRLFAALCEHWGIGPPDIVAHDFGGSTALRGHLLDGLEYRSLTLIDPVAISPQGSALVQSAKQHEDVFSHLPAYVHEAILRAYIDGAVAKALRTSDMSLYLHPWLGDEGQKAFWRQIAQMDDKYTQEIEWRYGEMRCPVTLIWEKKTSGARCRTEKSCHAGSRLR